MPGVHAVLTHGDVPGQKTYGLEFADQPVLAAERVRYYGEPVALVAAEEPEQARRAAAAVRVEYELLEPVVDMERATEQPPLHPERPTMAYGYREDDRPNVVRHLVIRHGDPDADGDVTVSGVYDVGIQDQAFLGPESGWPSPTARATSTSTSRHSGCTSTATRSRLPRGAAGDGADPPGRGRRRVRRPRGSRCRSTARCSRCTRSGP